MKDVLSFLKWLVSLPPTRLVVAILVLTNGMFIYHYYHNEKEQNIKAIEVEEKLDECTKIKEEFQKIKTEFLMFKANGDHLPIPLWIKNTEFKMIWLNKAFEEKYLEPKGMVAADCISKFDSFVFDEETSRAKRVSDRLVLKTQEPMNFIEDIEGEPTEVMKYPLIMGGVLIGIGGAEYQNFK